MKTFSDLIKENESNKKFNFNAIVTIEGSVYSEDEGNAGHQIDKEMDEITGMIKYEIINIEEDTSEGYINPDFSLTESNDDIDNKFRKDFYNMVDDMVITYDITKNQVCDLFDKYILELKSSYSI